MKGEHQVCVLKGARYSQEESEGTKVLMKWVALNDPSEKPRLLLLSQSDPQTTRKIHGIL